LLVLLLVGSGLLFAIGSTIERHQRHTEHPAQQRGESGSGESATHLEKTSGERGVKLLGVNTESLALTILAVIASLALGVAVWLRRWPRVTLLCVAGFGLVFAAGDVRELVHQLNESNAGVASIAAVLIVLHLAITASAAALYPRQRTTGNVVVA
jgi:hypothetical protein